MRRLDLLIFDTKQSLFKTNKIRNTTIKNSSDWSRGDDEHWLVLACGGADIGDGWHNTFESG
jgi:hypothetical protein